MTAMPGWHATAPAPGLTTLLHVAGPPHPPAGSSVLIVSLGLLHTPVELTVMAAAVVLMTLLMWGLNRLGGVRTGFVPHPVPPGRGEETTTGEQR